MKNKILTLQTEHAMKNNPKSELLSQDNININHLTSYQYHLLITSQFLEKLFCQIFFNLIFFTRKKRENFTTFPRKIWNILITETRVESKPKPMEIIWKLKTPFVAMMSTSLIESNGLFGANSREKHTQGRGRQAVRQTNRRRWFELWCFRCRSVLYVVSCYVFSLFLCVACFFR